ncbi:MAG: FHA domain-containing protein [Gemmataceae bacterium]|nr:FHA domain-containing protein [Gemmataceae bacterium]
MPLLSRIYFNAVFGALGGLLGWMLYGVFGERNPDSATFNALLGGALIGGVIGYFVVSVEAIRDLSLVKFARLASYGAGLGALGGAIGMLIGDKVNYWIVGAAAAATGETGLSGGALILTMLARGVGWSLLGMAIGMSEGFAARSLGKFSYGTLGGAIGGFVGGVLFQLFYAEAIQRGSTDYFWNAMGLVILGACIGSLSALVQAAFQPASVRVLRGWQEGREYPLEKPASLLGRAEHADVALFRDMKVEKQHAVIRRDHEQYVLVNNGAPAEQTRVNEQPIAASIALQDGDRIQLGNIVLRFQLRAALNRARAKRALPTATAT